MLPKPSTKNSAFAAMKFAGVGFSFLSQLAVFSLLGWYLDQKFQTGPWLLTLGCACGMFYGIRTLLRQAELYEEAESHSRNKQDTQDENLDD